MLVETFLQIAETGLVVVVALMKILKSKPPTATLMLMFFASKPSARVIILCIKVKDIIQLPLVALVRRCGTIDG